MGATLFDVLTGEDASAALLEFLAAWHGEPSGPFEVVESDLPDPLVRFHACLRAWPRAVIQDQLLRPPERLEDGRILFLVENQGVHLWATEPAGSDPIVWSRPNEEGDAWVEEGERLARFLVQVAVNEAIWGALHGGSAAWLPNVEAVQAIEPLTELPFAPWHWPQHPTRFYAGDGVVASTCPNHDPDDPEQHVSLFVAGSDAEAIAFLDAVVDERWDYYSRQ